MQKYVPSINSLALPPYYTYTLAMSYGEPCYRTLGMGQSGKASTSNTLCVVAVTR